MLLFPGGLSPHTPLSYPWRHETSLPARAPPVDEGTGMILPAWLRAFDPRWANRGCYRADTERLAARPADERRIVFLGDSITQDWPLATLGPGIVNRGIGGQTAQQMRQRLDQDVLTLRPLLVHLLAGTNDIAGNAGPRRSVDILDDIAAMAARARSAGVQVVIGTIPPALNFPWRPGLAPSARIVDLNARLRAHCATEAFVLADYHAALATGDGAMRTGFALDGVHPTPAGYEAMRPVALDAIQRALA
jgi:lysophospholipase L1-like esterase